MSELAKTARVVRALGARSIRQTFRRPQLISPIVVFPTLLLAIALITASALAVGGIGAAIALRTGSASVVQGLFPLVLVVLFLSSAFFPQELMVEPAKTIAEYNPLSFIVEGVREPIIAGIDLTHTLEAVAAIIGIVALGLLLSARALRHRLRVG